MRAHVFLLFLFLTAPLTYSSPVEPQRWLLSRPNPASVNRLRRNPQTYYIQVRRYPVKGNSQPATERPEPSLAKGEYLCGNKVCKLQPGEIPKGCNGVCQYRV